jgi:PBP1b-binding outer membrane lipoprotein LpoB
MSGKFSVSLFSAIFSLILMTSGCAVEAAKSQNEAPKQKIQTLTENSQPAPKIKIEPNSPADTVRSFYKNLREKKFREAIFLTNLRPAIEGLTENELKDLEVDFASLAQQVPAEIEINGEIISGEKAAVTAKLPDGEANQLKLQQIKLRRENGVWIILTVDEQAESAIKKEGRNYFFNLRIETHHSEARDVFDRIMKAEMIHALQNGGSYADAGTLIAKNLLSSDLSSGSTVGGYNYKIAVSADKKQYSVTAEPTDYGKTGKLSFRLDFDGKNNPKLREKNNKGQPLK